jgi:hypothetical protein
MEKEQVNQEQKIDTGSIFFEDDAEIKLRDGKVYKIPPATLKDARIMMSKLKTVNVDFIIINFISGEDGEGNSREEDLFDILKIAFKNYPEVTKEYIEEYVDVDLAKKIIEIIIGLNGLKK